jgi:hypothetical protein
MYSFGQNIIIERTEGGVVSNVPQDIIYHSPDGFEYGYGGSGPADLALNILFAVTKDKDFAMKYHQQFKEMFIATLKQDVSIHIIPFEDVIDFIVEKQKVK